MSALDRVQTVVLRTVLGLPESWQRRLGGRPVVRDGDRLAPEVQLMLRLQELAGEPGIETLPLAEARRALVRQAAMVGGRQPIGEVRALSVDGAEGPLPARLYVPTSGEWPAPLLVFFHGGGFLYGDLDSHDAPCRYLAEQAGVRVLAVDYRLSPEHKHPAPSQDCAAAYRWALSHTEELGADPARIGVGGDSAGGYLAAVTAITAAEEGLPCAFQLLVYPATDMRGQSASRQEFAEGFFLTKQFMDNAEEAWLSPGDDVADPVISPALRTSLPEGLAPAFVATAAFDPLRDEGEQYAEVLRRAGVPVELRRYPGLIHGFLNSVGAGHRSPAAVRDLADVLERGLAGR